jgi:hypothetical protein
MLEQQAKDTRADDNTIAYLCAQQTFAAMLCCSGGLFWRR